MHFPSLSIKNFLTIGEAELDLANRGLILIQGVNEDDTSATSNGAGKSSIVDALCWCLYGVTARDVSGDSVVNRTAKKDCSVGVKIVDGTMEYTITRYRKHKTHKNALIVTQADTTTHVVGDLTKGTDKETQEVVNKIMGCSLAVFIGAIYAGQEAMPDLPGMTDKHLKLLVEEAAGVEELADAYNEARSRMLKVEQDYNTAQTHEKVMAGTLGTARTEHQEAVDQAQLFEDQRKDRARAKMAPIKPAQERVAELQAKLTTLKPAHDIEAAIATLTVKIDGRKKEEADLATLQNNERTAGQKEDRFRQTAAQLKNALETAKKQLEDVDKQVGKPCDECGKPYCEKDLDSVRGMRERAVKHATEELADTLALARQAIADRKAALQLVNDFIPTMTDVSIAVAQIAAQNTELREVTDLGLQVLGGQRVIEEAKTAAKLCLTEPNPWATHVTRRAANIEKIEKEQLTAQAAAMSLETKVQLYKDAVALFGPAGVRAHILDTVTPFLNEKTGEYLGALSDGNIHAEWSTLTKTAKGDLKEKFNIDVTHDEGGDEFKAISGGEKRKVRLSTNMALQDMVASRASKPIDLWIGDEIDQALDDAGLERLMGVLEKKARERGTVLVISHHAISDWIDTVITITKKEKFSTVSGATQAGM